MRATYVASDNSAGDAQVLGAAGRDIYVRAICFGTATGGKITHFYNSSVSSGHTSGMGSVDDTNLVWYFVQPTFGAGKDQVNMVNFGNAPLQLDGGSFHTDESTVTVIWEYVDEASSI